MGFNWERVGGALLFALFGGLLALVFPLGGDEPRDLSVLASVLPLGAVIGYMIWPGLALAWSRRRKRRG